MKDSSIDNYRITGRESLDMLLKKKERRYGRFVIEVENMDENKARQFENDLNKFYASCGCSTGNYFLITTLVLCAAYLYITGRAISNWTIIIQGCFILFIAAVLGKFIGKLLDGFKFKKTVEKLSHELF